MNQASPGASVVVALGAGYVCIGVIRQKPNSTDPTPWIPLVIE